MPGEGFGAGVLHEAVRVDHAEVGAHQRLDDVEDAARLAAQGAPARVVADVALDAEAELRDNATAVDLLTEPTARFEWVAAALRVLLGEHRAPNPNDEALVRGLLNNTTLLVSLARALAPGGRVSIARGAMRVLRVLFAALDAVDAALVVMIGPALEAAAAARWADAQAACQAEGALKAALSSRALPSARFAAASKASLRRVSTPFAS